MKPIEKLLMKIEKLGFALGTIAQTINLTDKLNEVIERVNELSKK